MTYLSIDMDTFLKFGLFGCFNPTGRSVNTLLIYQTFMGDMLILDDYINVMLLRYDGKYRLIIFMLKCI